MENEHVLRDDGMLQATVYLSGFHNLALLTRLKEFYLISML